MKKALFLAAICCTFLVACNLSSSNESIVTTPDSLKVNGKCYLYESISIEKLQSMTLEEILSTKVFWNFYSFYSKDSVRFRSILLTFSEKEEHAHAQYDTIMSSNYFYTQKGKILNIHANNSVLQAISYGDRVVVNDKTYKKIED